MKNILFFAVSLFSILSFSQVTTSLDSTEIRIGEELKFSIQVQADTTDLVVFPEGQTFLPLEVIESYKVDTTYENAKYRLIKKYGLTQFDSGAYMIPSQQIFINETPYITDSLKIEVRDVPVDTLQQKMFDIKPALELKNLPFNFLKLLYWLIPILGIAGLLLLIFHRRKKRKEAEEKQLPPYEEAIVALKVLDSSDLLKLDKSKEYYSQLTEIVKRYLDREVDEAALESTSDELIARLQLHKDAGHFDFDTETIKHLDQILKRADLVKFAKMRQESSQATADRNTIEEIINDTHEVIPEPTEEELLRNEEYLRDLKRKKRKKNVIIGATTGVVALMLLIGISTTIYGWSYVRDTIFGHPTKDLLEGQWVRSEYGVPTVILESPEVLMRAQNEKSYERQQSTLSSEFFTYGSLEDRFYILLNVATYREGINLDFEIISEEMLSNLEQLGASNMIVKRENFSTEEGIEGEKIYGEFNFTDKKKSRKSEKMEYEIILFKKGQSLQILAMYYSKEDIYASEVKKRMFNSVELEISEK
jgi:hypothetical protein